MKLSFIILTRNRVKDLQENLRELELQQTNDFEFVVVDNNSDEETVQIVRKTFNKARLITLSTNQGVAAGRNAGIKAAAGEVLVFIDDDAVLRDKAASKKIVSAFRDNPRLGILGFAERNYYAPDQPVQWHYQGRSHAVWATKEFEAAYFPGAGHAIRAAALKNTGLYPEEYFYSTEEKDLAYRMINAGWDIWYTPDVEVFHKVNLNERNLWRNYFDVRNHIWFAWRLLPWPYSTAHYVLHTARFAIKNFPERLYLVTRGVRDAWRRRTEILRDRHPIKPATRKKIQQLRKSWFWWL